VISSAFAGGKLAPPGVWTQRIAFWRRRDEIVEITVQ